MVNLLDYKSEIEQFITEGLQSFTSEYGAPSTMGVYCCPYNGWISLNFNLDPNSTSDNCPDFEYVEYYLIEYDDWRDEYNTLNTEWIDLSGNVIKFEFGEGDESLNKLFFDYLKALLIEIKESNAFPATFLQMLDSNYGSLI